MALLSHRHMLVVEDEMLVLMSIETMLQELGCTAILSVATVAGALALLMEQRFDAAMLDVNLGGENSAPVADALVARGIPFVYSTGCRDDGEQVRFADYPILKKPYVPAQLANAMSGLLAGIPVALGV